MCLVQVLKYTPFADSLDDEAGHGTHVSATIVGSAEGGHGSCANSLNGIASDAKIAFYDVISVS